MVAEMINFKRLRSFLSEKAWTKASPRVILLPLQKASTAALKALDSIYQFQHEYFEVSCNKKMVDDRKCPGIYIYFLSLLVFFLILRKSTKLAIFAFT